jgi:hypothetical protein
MKNLSFVYDLLLEKNCIFGFVSKLWHEKPLMKCLFINHVYYVTGSEIFIPSLTWQKMKPKPVYTY